jgi:RNA polymerase sigma factor (TIGR02999 family)
MSEVSRILEAMGRGDRRAADALLPRVYDELRTLAAQRLLQERPGHSLQATALVHEAYLRLIGPANEDGFQSRRHFFGAAAEAMRRILIDHARHKQAEIHGGGRQRCDLSKMDAVEAASASPEAWFELNDALDVLAAQDALAAELFKLRYFTGLSVEEAAELLSLSRTEAYRKWTFLRAWLGSLYGAVGR